MKVLVTGAFGNIGTSAVQELIRQGHDVCCFDLKTRANQRLARPLAGKAEIVWGDLRRPEQIVPAVAGCDVVIHLAFIIPKLSVTGLESERAPEWAREVNVGGTANLLAALRAQPRPAKIIFSSSLHVYGRTNDRPPIRTVSDPVEATDHYTRHKIECEELVRSSGLEWTILRFAAVLPLALRLDRGMFDIPPWNRMEFVYTRDVGLALANAVVSPAVWGRVLLIGGGQRCQLYYREITGQVLDAIGLGGLPEAAFSTVPFATDWLDTAESQRILQYQRHGLEDYAAELRRLLGYRRPFIRGLRPFIRLGLLWQSPFYRRRQPAHMRALWMALLGRLHLAAEQPAI